MILGIDASNISSGGGVTHLVELLRAAEPMRAGFTQVTVWSRQSTLDQLDARPWLLKQADPQLERNLFFRSWWQRFRLASLAQQAGCDVLFVPGGNDVSGFRCTVTMSQNMLPFEWRELRRFGFSLFSLRFFLLRWSQGASFRRARGVLFLTEYARDGVQKVVGKLGGQSKVIAHGLHRRFFQAPRPQREGRAFVADAPCRVVYVSIVHIYKHQWHVVEAVRKLRDAGHHVVLELIGPAGSGSALLAQAIAQHDPDGQFVRYRGAVPYENLHQLYAAADIGLFASSCENLPNILLENMAAGLPIACSNFGPMPEVLGAAGTYFSPEEPEEIAIAIETLMRSPELRAEYAYLAYAKATHYTWEHCASETFSFLREIGGGTARGS